MNLETVLLRTVVCAAALSASCAAYRPPFTEDAKASPKADEHQATLVFLWPTTSCDPGGYVVLATEDGHFLGTLSTGTQLRSVVPAGPISIVGWNDPQEKARGDAVRSAVAVLHGVVGEGRTHYVQLKFGEWDDWGPREQYTARIAQPGHRSCISPDNSTTTAMVTASAASAAWNEVTQEAAELEGLAPDRAAGQGLARREPRGAAVPPERGGGALRRAPLASAEDGHPRGPRRRALVAEALRTSPRGAHHAHVPRPMITVHFWPTPNGKKITVALEEMGLEYKIEPVNIGKGEQFRPEFLAISPNNRMPAIVDDDPPGGGAPIAIFESGAILLYLGDKTGKLLPRDIRGRTEVTEWLMWQMGGLGPMAGQTHHFRSFAPEKIPYAIDRYTNESHRLYGVLDKRLAGRQFVCGSEISIADVAAYPWIHPEGQGQNLADFPDLAAWMERMKTRPAVARGMEIGSELRK